MPTELRPRPRTRTRLFTLLIIALVPTPPIFAQQAPPVEQTSRTPAPVMSYHGIPWLERATRDEEEQPYEVIKTMGLENGVIIADIGAGSGYFSRKMARAVAPDGKVYAVDIQPEMIAYLTEAAIAEDIDNIEPVLGEAADPKLPPASIDWMLLTDVYHEFQQPEPMLAKMRDALKPDGRVALIEYRLHGDTAKHIKLEHRMSIEQVTAEWEPAGFELVEIHEFLPAQHFFIFKKDPNFDKESNPE